VAFRNYSFESSVSIRSASCSDRFNSWKINRDTNWIPEWMSIGVSLDVVAKKTIPGPTGNRNPAVQHVTLLTKPSRCYEPRNKKGRNRHSYDQTRECSRHSATAWEGFKPVPIWILAEYPIPCLWGISWLSPITTAEGQNSAFKYARTTSFQVLTYSTFITHSLLLKECCGPDSYEWAYICGREKQMR